jgi:iron complex outermembrane receptor protein
MLSVALLMSFTATAQLQLSGSITEKKNNAPLAGASISVEGLFAGTHSDAGGHYTLTLKPGTYLIKVSYVGYKTEVQSCNLQSNTQLNFSLTESALLQDEVVVSASRVNQNQPLTFSSINKEKIDQLNFGQDIPVLLSNTPSLVSSSDAGNGVGYTNLRVRGSDITRINVTLNGIPVNDAESQGVFWVNMPDLASSLDNVQIQRGIGTSGNGAAAFGASINLESGGLRQQAYAQYDLGVGSFNTWKHTMQAGTGLLKEHWTFDLRLSKLNSDGFIDRASSDLKSLYFSAGYYGKKSMLKFLIISGKEKTYQAWEGIPKDSLATNRTYNPFSYENQTDNYQQDNYQLLFSTEASKRVVVNAALHYTFGRGYYEEFREGDDFASYGLPYPIIGNDTILSTDLVRQKWLKNHFAGFTLSANYDNKHNLQIIAGGAANKYFGDHFGNIIQASVATTIPMNYQWYFNTSKKAEYNIYAKMNYRPAKKLYTWLDLQFRVVDFLLDSVDSKLRDITQDHHFYFFNPKAGVTWHINTKHSLYVSAAWSHREPNGNNFADADLTKPAPKAEKMLNAELGYHFSARNIATGINAFYMYYIDQLVLTGEINDVGYAIMTNVPKSYRAGIELNASARFWKVVNWEANAAFSINKINDFTEYVDDWDNGGQITNPLGNTTIAFSPSIVAGNTFRVNVCKGLNLTLNTKFISRQYVDNTQSKDRSLDGYSVSDFIAEYALHPKPLRHLKFSLILNNIFNHQYENNAWVYRYFYEGKYQVMDGYFPQAGINVMAGMSIGF